MNDLGDYTRARQSETQLGRDQMPAPTVDLQEYVRATQPGRQSWSPNLTADEPTP